MDGKSGRTAITDGLRRITLVREFAANILKNRGKRNIYVDSDTSSPPAGHLCPTIGLED